MIKLKQILSEQETDSYGYLKPGAFMSINFKRSINDLVEKYTKLSDRQKWEVRRKIEDYLPYGGEALTVLIDKRAKKIITPDELLKELDELFFTSSKQADFKDWYEKNKSTLYNSQ